jgi:hypothetical protein
MLLVNSIRSGSVGRLSLGLCIYAYLHCVKDKYIQLQSLIKWVGASLRLGI